PSGTGSIGIGFAIPVDQVRSVLESLEKYGDSGSVRSGISIQVLIQNVAASLGFDGQGGVLVSEIEPVSPGDRSGFRRGDIITEINEFRVLSIEQAHDFFRGAYPGEVFEMRIFRNRSYQTLTLVLGEEE
ncbi:S1C family serine protease, partial [Candidatus Latescibacterota bacterium]